MYPLLRLSISHHLQFPLPFVLSNTHTFLFVVSSFLLYYLAFAAAIQRTMVGECPVGWEPATGWSSESEESQPEDEKAACLNQIVGSLSKCLTVWLCFVFEYAYDLYFVA